MDNATKPQTYNSISEIRERKEAILAEMRKDNADIGKNGKACFRNHQKERRASPWRL